MQITANSNQLIQSFRDKIDCSGECWLWLAGKNQKGYGMYRSKLAHRYAYEQLVGEIPKGLQLDHLCRVRNCVNPMHLEPVTLQENIRRGNTGKYHRNITHCPHGHEYTIENTYRHNGKRYCRQCKRITAERLRGR